MSDDEFETLQGLLADEIVDETLSCLQLSFCDDASEDDDIYEDELSTPEEARDIIMSLR